MQRTLPEVCSWPFLQSARLRYRGLLQTGLLVLALFGTTSRAMAEPQVSLSPAPDGTLILVGRDWRPGQRMIVSVDQDLFAALADSVGDFEVETGLVANGGPPAVLAVRQPNARITAMPSPASAHADAPHPFAILFAQSLMTGTALLAMSIASLGSASLAAHYIRGRRSAHDLRKP